MAVGPEARSSNAHPMPTQVTYMSKVVSRQLGVVGMVANWRTYVLPKEAVTFELKVTAAFLKCRSGEARPFDFSRKGGYLDFCINC